MGHQDRAATAGEPVEASRAAWPALSLAAWQDTYATLHLWTQFVGNVRMALSPPLNHWWATALYVNPRALTTSSIPYGTRTFEVAFDFLDHTLWIQSSDGARRAMGLYPRSVADYYRDFMGLLRSLEIAVTRFSGHRAPERPGANRITREAYSHEVSRCGFWPGTVGGAVQEPAYYAYMAPEPAGFAGAVVQPAAAAYQRDLGEFILPYEAVRTAADPDAKLLAFVQSTHEAGANLAGWDRASLER